LFPDIGASFFLQQCPGLLGLFLALTGTRIRIADCCYARLIDYYVPSNQLSEMVQALRASDLPIDSHDTIVQLIEAFSVTPDVAPLKAHQFLIDGVFSNDSVDDMVRVLKNDDGQWTQVIVEHLQQRSPLSLAVTFQAMKRAQGWSLAECLQQDFVLGQSFLNSHDLYEGIRAVLIEKDMSPKWQPAQLSDCTSDVVDAYFSCDTKQLLNF
jgi:enoyl-CoA hydratase